VSAVIGGVVLETLQTTFAALAWLGILRAAFPHAGSRSASCSRHTRWRRDERVPAGQHRHLRDALPVHGGDRGRDVRSGLLGPRRPEIPFSVFNIALYLYLFFTVSSSLSVDLGVVSDHPGLVAAIAVGAVVLLALVARIFWRRAAKLRAQLATGGAVLKTHVRLS